MCAASGMQLRVLTWELLFGGCKRTKHTHVNDGEGANGGP